VVDTALLLVTGRPLIGAVVGAAAFSVAIGWWLDRGYKQRAQQHVAAEASTTPPVGSWANPSKRQRWAARWDAMSPYRRRRRP
jgi:hypothetical protein